MWMSPYTGAGVALDLHFGGNFEGDEFEVDHALDVGLDLLLDSARNVVVRAAASLGDRQAFVIGVAVGGGGRTRYTRQLSERWTSHLYRPRQPFLVCLGGVPCPAPPALIAPRVSLPYACSGARAGPISTLISRHFA